MLPPDTFRGVTLGRGGRSASLLWHFPPMRMNVNRCVISRRSRLTSRLQWGSAYLPEIRRLTLAWRLRTLRFRPARPSFGSRPLAGNQESRIILLRVLANLLNSGPGFFMARVRTISQTWW